MKNNREAPNKPTNGLSIAGKRKITSDFLFVDPIEEPDKEEDEEEILRTACQKRKKFLEQEAEKNDEDVKDGKVATAQNEEAKSILKSKPSPAASKTASSRPAMKPVVIGMDEKTNIFTGKKYSSKYYEILAKRMTLPAWEAKDPLFELMQMHQVVVLQGETGSGKTTQVPQFLLRSELRQ